MVFSKNVQFLLGHPVHR